MFLLHAIAVAATIFTAAVQAKISSPMKGESWAAGHMETIKWDTSQMRGRMKMHLCKGGATDISESVLIISESVENTGSYSWTPNKSIESISSFTIILVDIEIKSYQSISDEFYISGLLGVSSHHGSHHSDSHHEYKTHSDSHDYHTQTHSYETTTLALSSSVAENTNAAYTTVLASSSIESAQVYSSEVTSAIVYSSAAASIESSAAAETTIAASIYSGAAAVSTQSAYSTLTTQAVAASYAAPPYATTQASNYTVLVASSTAAASSAVVVFTGAASGLRASAGMIASLGAVGLLFLL